MSEPKPFASLSASLLARKGAARPAMRPSSIAPQPVAHQHDALARAYEADDVDPAAANTGSGEANASDWSNDLGWNDMGEAHETVAHAGGHVVVALPVATAAARPAADPIRRSALADGRRAAFTLRIDADRHLKLRLACTVDGRSAQQLLIDALDQYIAANPELDALAARVRASR